MTAVRIAAASAVFCAIVGAAVAQPAPPLGEWVGAGEYCARGVRAVVPPGYEAINFGNGVEIRPAGDDARTVAELASFPRSGGMPDFDGFAERMQLPCKEGFEPASSRETRAAEGLGSLDVLVRRCVGPSTSYGFYFARATLTVAGGDHDASVMALYGDEPWRVGGVSFGAEDFFAETDAAALFETMTAGLAACAALEPPPPPPPPEPTGWLGAGAHCAFGIGATAPEGFEFRFNGLASNGGTIDLRLAGVDERAYHRSRIFVWPLYGEALAPPEASDAFDRCIDGFEPRRFREERELAGSGPLHLLVEGCFSETGEYYGALSARRSLALPGGDHEALGAFTIGSSGLPPTLAWTEFEFLTEDEARMVVDGFIASMGACEN